MPTRLTATCAVVLVCLASAVVVAQSSAPAASAPATAKAQAPDVHALNVQYKDLKWQKMQPELGDRSAEIAILHVDPVSKATQLMIRVPKNFHVPKHWHSANETHSIVKGSFIMECDGKREVLDQWSFNYVPAKLQHEAWTKPNEGALVFITVDSAWDINWVNGNPKPGDFIGGRKN